MTNNPESAGPTNHSDDPQSKGRAEPDQPTEKSRFTEGEEESPRSPSAPHSEEWRPSDASEEGHRHDE